MVFLYAKKKILRGTDIVDPKVEPVFEGTPAEAKDLDGLKSARPATADEINAFKERKNKANGIQPQAPVTSDQVVVNDTPAPVSGDPNDPKSPPKSRGA